MTNANTGRTIAAGAALGFLAGLAVSPTRKLMLQGAEMLTGDWYNILKTEHRLVEKAFEVVLKTSDRQTGRRQVLLLQIAHALNKHAIQEENVIYPALRAVDEAAAKHLVEDHADVKSLLHDLQYVYPKDDPRWLDAMRQLRDTVVAHAREEEDEIFPKLRNQGEGLNMALTRQMNWEGIKVA